MRTSGGSLAANLFLTAMLVLGLTGCAPTADSDDTNTQPKDEERHVTVSSFGKTAEGEEVKLFTLTNKQGAVAKITNYGATLVALEIPDKRGKLANVVLAYDTLENYVKDSSYFGATVGRYGNRIANGKFQIDGQTYSLATNNGPNHLHGGAVGFNKKVWQAETHTSADGGSVKFTYISPDGEEGYPGRLIASVTYFLTDDNELGVDYEATTDKPTHCNLTHHSYFNLAGDNAGDVLDHSLTLNCDEFLPVDATQIPTGEIAPVKGTPMDFTTAKSIGKEITAEEGLYDHCFVVRPDAAAGKLRLAARVSDPKSGRTMEILTTEPGIQFYTANHLDNVKGRAGATYNKHQGFCLETQHYPDTPNKPQFPTTLLKPGETYRSTTIHKFSAK